MDYLSDGRYEGGGEERRGEERRMTVSTEGQGRGEIEQDWFGKSQRRALTS
jgi:hypothetical protein